MKPLLKRLLFCTVPINQKPLTQYFERKQNFLTTFIENFLDIKKIKNNFIFFLFYFLTFSIFLYFSFFKNFLILLSLITLFTYFYWREMLLIFFKSSFFYEESSWFEIFLNEKTFYLIKSDMLLGTQKVRPQLQKTIKRVLTLFTLVIGLILQNC